MNSLLLRTLVVSCAAMLFISEAAYSGQLRASARAQHVNLKVLESRLRNTDAIGLFAKLDIKSQLDELTGALERYRLGDRAARIEVLKARFDQLLRQVLAMLQHGDPDLHRELRKARLAIWSSLAGTSL